MEFLGHLRGHLLNHGHVLETMMFLLNKRDLWERSNDPDQLRKWERDIAETWKNSALAKRVEFAEHSNLIPTDITKFALSLREQIRSVRDAK